MRPEVLAVMHAQQGLVTRRQAIEAGVPAERIDQMVRRGTWVLVRRGVYCEAEVAAAATQWQAQRLLVDRAASLVMRRAHVMSHDSAALMLGLAILRPPLPMTHVSRPGLVGSHCRHDIKHHLAPYSPEQVVSVDGRRMLAAARTAADVAREHSLTHGVVACDSARRAGVSLAELWAAVEPMRCWPQVTRVREAVELSDGESDSPGETLTRLLLTELGLGRPQTQFGLTEGRRTAWIDLRLGRHLVEFDGRVKYQRLDEGGLALSPSEVVWREKTRQDWLCGFKLGMSRVVWDDLWGQARATTLARLRREVRDTEARFGSSIEDLTPYLARGPRPRPRFSGSSPHVA